MPRILRGIFLCIDLWNDCKNITSIWAAIKDCFYSCFWCSIIHTSQLTPLHNKIIWFYHKIYFVGKVLHIFEL